MSIASKTSWIGRLVAGLNGVGAVLILAMAMLICADIIGRSFLGKPIAGVAEMIRLSIVAVVFLQIGQAVRANALARTELLANTLKTRSPRVEASLQAVYSLIGALFFAVLVYGVWFKLVDAWTSDEHAGVYGLFVAPVWPVYATIALGSCAAGIQFLAHMIGHLSRAIKSKGHAQ